MPEHIIPANAGPYRIVLSRAGTPLDENDCTGKRKVRIPCKTPEQAKEICRRLNENDHNGIIGA
jgi:hypothetical protein